MGLGGPAMSTNIDDNTKLNLIADYICHRALSADTDISPLKLHKLLYYVEAWHLAFFDSSIVPGKFQAWVHGPVCRTLYVRYRNNKSMYCSILKEDLRCEKFDSLSEEEKSHIDNVLETYMKFSDTQLEALTHGEDPWIKAREGRAEFERGEEEIDENLMRDYYKKRLN